MSIERDLLKRVISEDDDFFVIYDLYKEIYELLAQPEHIPDVGNMVEPVAWMQDSVELYVLEEKSAIRGYVIPLYTSPPKPLTPREALTEYKKGYARAELDLKREPLSEQTIWNANTEQLFEEGVRWAEQQHRIIGEDDE